MNLAQQKQQFSIAYVRAVASVAGYTLYTPEVDDDSVDLGIAARRGAGGTVRAPRIEVQLKCTADSIWQNDPMSFELKQKNYDDLRGDVIVPRILVVLCVPESLNDWLMQNEEQLVLRRCAYWLSLADYPENTNITTTTVYIPAQNTFTVAALTHMMQKVAQGEAL